jgi:hypothetical protein
MTISKSKSVKLPVSCATVKVSVASATAPAAKVEPCLFQVNVKTDDADTGLQSIVLKLNETATFPAFFT